MPVDHPWVTQVEQLLADTAMVVVANLYGSLPDTASLQEQEYLPMEWLEHLEKSLASFVTIAVFCLETISVFCVVVGLIKTIQLAFQLSRRHRGNDFPFNQVRLRFGIWLALALEFQLGADILTTTVSSDIQTLINLAVLAIVRILLNYFLGKELETEMELEKQRSENRRLATNQDSLMGDQ